MTQLIHTESGRILADEEQARKHYTGVTAAINGGYGTTLDPELVNVPAEIDGVEDGNELLATLLATGLYSIHNSPAPTPLTETEIALQRQYLVDAIASAAREYVEHRANAALQDELRDSRALLNIALASNPNPEQLAEINTKLNILNAVRDWGKVVYNEAEVNKALAQAGVSSDYAVLCDFTAHGDKPYTVYQLYQAGLVTL